MTTQVEVLLYVPNIIGYFRLVLTIFVDNYVGFAMYRAADPYVFIAFYLFGFALDGVDGYIARRLRQTSSFGSLLDVLIDNILRTMLLSHVGGPLAFVPICFEWLTFVCSHSLGASWKTELPSQQRKPPRWFTVVFERGFWNPYGILCIAGLHFFPLWLYCVQTIPSSPLSTLFLGATLLLGRLYSSACELWTISGHLQDVLHADCEAKKKR